MKMQDWNILSGAISSLGLVYTFGMACQTAQLKHDAHGSPEEPAFAYLDEAMPVLPKGDERAPASAPEPVDASDWDFTKLPGVGSYWQKRAPQPPETAEQTDHALRSGADAGCPAGMVRAQGKMKLGTDKKGSVEALQDKTCVNWIDRQFPARCAEFSRDQWRALSADLPTRDMSFCIDRYEYPNRHGAYPVVQVSWVESKALCAKQGKRLCTEDEWTFACEGEEALPYPYGYVRDSSKCNIDRPWLDYSKVKLSPRSAAGPGLAALWRGETSGARAECKSPFGVYDQAGNVDEWTSSVSRKGFKSIMKGGYWSVVRNRCRPATRAHNESHVFYQQGFRCCS